MEIIVSNVTIGSSSKNSTKTLDIFYFYKTEQLTFLIVLLIVTVFTNITLIYNLIKYKRTSKSRMNYFIKQLAIADLLNSSLNISVDILSIIVLEWKLGNVMCKSIRYLQAAFAYAATYAIVALTVDRYYVVAHPLNFTVRKKIAKYSVTVGWTLSFMFSVPSLILFNKSVIQNKVQCWIHLEIYQWRIYITIIANLVYFIPMIIIVYCYIRIAWIVWLKSKLLNVNRRKSLNSTILLRELDKEDDSNEIRRDSSTGILSKARIKTIKTSFLVIIAFIVCWSPYFIYNLLEVYGYITRTQTTIAISTFVQSLAPLNSAVNPIIYGMSSIKEVFRKFIPFSWLFRKNYVNQNVTDIGTG